MRHAPWLPYEIEWNAPTTNAWAAETSGWSMRDGLMGSAAWATNTDRGTAAAPAMLHARYSHHRNLPMTNHNVLDFGSVNGPFRGVRCTFTDLRPQFLGHHSRIVSRYVTFASVALVSGSERGGMPAGILIDDRRHHRHHDQIPHSLTSPSGMMHQPCPV